MIDSNDAIGLERNYIITFIQNNSSARIPL